MTNFSKGTYKINSSRAGFSNVTRPDGILHNLSDKTIARLKKEDGIKFVKSVIEPVTIEPSDNDIIPENEGNKPDLSKLNKSDLSEIAKRLGFTDEINNDVTKAILIKFIEDNS
jgi:hypothetical protein